MTKQKLRLPKFLTNGNGGEARSVSLVEVVRPESERTGAPAKRLPAKLAVYLAVVTLAAGGCIAYFASQISSDGWQGLVTLIVVAIILERVGVNVYGDAYVSAGVVALFAVAVVYGAPGAALAAPLVILAITILERGRWYHRLFDAGFYTLANVSAALAFHALIDVDGGLSGWWVPAALFAIIVNYAVNAALMSAQLSLQSGDHWSTEWRQTTLWTLPHFVVFGLLGLALAAGYLALGVPGILAFVAPSLMMRFALHQYVAKTEQTVLELKAKNAELKVANRDVTRMAQRLTETYDGTLEALVLALDARDRETKGHSLRVAEYALAIARKMGVEEGSQDWVDIQRGALLHDVGKIGVPDYILHKPGPLTPEEWDEMKRHPHIGHEMLRDISFLAGAAAIVHAHHERFDGKGYPRGLTSDLMPLGARIFTVCDTFDSMTSDRPYRKALTPEVARDEIVRHSGTQFDPQVVQAFLLVYVEFLAAVDEEHREEHARAA